MVDPSIAPLLSNGVVFNGRYRVLRCLDAGGMGAVYEVVHVETERHQALKVMLPNIVADPEMRARFRLEARVTSKILSDHIVETADAGIDAETGAPFLVMELLQGRDLGGLVDHGGPLPAQLVVTLLKQVALALDKTHAAGVVHRDLKPENLFLTERDDGSPCVKILDFGIAKVVSESVQSKQTATLGTPLYMSPEQIQGDGSIGPQSDVFALGHIAYALLAGEAYWEEEARTASAVFALLSRMIAGHTELPSARAARRGVTLPGAFDEWFARATAKDPAARFSRASELVDRLAQVLVMAGPKEPFQLSRALGDQHATRVSAVDVPAALSGSVRGVTGSRVGGNTTVAVSSDRSRASARSKGSLLVAGMLIAVALGAGVLFFLRSGERAEVAPSRSVTPATAEVETARATAAPPSPPPTPAEASATATAASPEPPPELTASASPAIAPVPVAKGLPLAKKNVAPPVTTAKPAAPPAPPPPPIAAPIRKLD